MFNSRRFVGHTPEKAVEVTSLFAAHVGKRKLVKMPPALIKSFLRGQPVHGALQACKGVEKFLQFYAEFVELHENDFSERRRDRLEGSIVRCRGAVSTVRREKSALRKELTIVSTLL